jgi:Protein of unknown function (DUF3263)
MPSDRAPDPDRDLDRAAPAAAEVAAVPEPPEPPEPLEAPGDAESSSAMSDASLPGAQGGLSARDRSILALESRTFRYVGAKERAIREEIGVSKVAYYVRLNSLLDDPAALRAAPVVVNRLRGRRTSEDGSAPSRGADQVA